MIVLGIAAATLVAFVVSSAYYGLMPAASGSSGRPAPWQIAAELARSALTAGLVAGFLRVGGWDGVGAGALLGLVLWILPFVLLTGSVVWEGVPVRRAALHTGDWLVKLLAIGALVGTFA